MNGTSTLPGWWRALAAAEIVAAAALSTGLLLIYDGFDWPGDSTDVAEGVLLILSPLALAVPAAIAAHRLWRRHRRRSAIAWLVLPGALPLIAFLAWAVWVA